MLLVIGAIVIAAYISFPLVALRRVRWIELEPLDRRVIWGSYAYYYGLIATLTGLVYCGMHFELLLLELAAIVLLLLAVLLSPLVYEWIRAFAESAFRFGRVFCKECSYNLRGNTSGICPECGTSVGHKEM